jgi:ASC-1-like (ASCH) protein
MTGERVRDMSIRPYNLEKIASGDKTIEVRVAYPNNRKLGPGQLLRFLAGEDACLARIVRITEYPSFAEMLDHEDNLAIGYAPETTRDEMLTRLRTLFPGDKESLGVLAIEIARAGDEPTSY